MNGFPRNYIARHGKIYDYDKVKAEQDAALAEVRARFEGNGLAGLSPRARADALVKRAAAQAGRYIREGR